MAATTASNAVTAAHRSYVKSLYKRYLTNSLNWAVHRDVWREQAMEIRAEFDKHRDESDPKAVAKILADAEAKLAAKTHPDPYISAKFPGGTGWERNLPPPPNAFTKYELDGHHHSDHHHATETVEDLGVLTEYTDRAGGKLRLSPQARDALASLARNYHNHQTYAKMLNDQSHIDPKTGKPRVGPNGKEVVSDLQGIIEAGRKKGVDLRALEFDDMGNPVSEFTEEEKKAVLQEVTSGSAFDRFNLQAIGILEQEVSNARNAKDHS